MIEIKHVRQPHGSKLCGQCCVAMIMGRELSEIVEHLGESGTRWAQLKDLLEANGFEVSGGLNKFTENHFIWETAIVKSHHEHSTHWMVRNGPYLHDPELPSAVGWSDKYTTLYKSKPEVRITSWVGVRKA